MFTNLAILGAPHCIWMSRLGRKCGTRLWLSGAPKGWKAWKAGSVAMDPMGGPAKKLRRKGQSAVLQGAVKALYQL